MAASVEQMWRDLDEADRLGDTELAQEIARQIKLVENRESRSVPQELGRQVGLTGRYIAEGVGSIGDVVGSAINSALGAAGVDIRIPSTSQTISSGLTAMGVPQPETPFEERVAEASRFVAGAAGPVKAGQFLSEGAEIVAREVGKRLASNPAIQATSAATAGFASEAAEQAGATPGQQAAATLVAGLAPGVVVPSTQAFVRGGFRGGEAGRQTVAQNIDDFSQSGTTPTVGQATQNRRTQALESGLSRTPGSAGRMAQKADTQAQEIGAMVRQRADELAPGATATRAGAEIERGIVGQGGFVSRFQQRASSFYDDVDTHLDTTAPIRLDQTTKLINAANPSVDAAPRTARMLGSKWFEDLGVALNDDIAAQLDATGFEGLPYAAVKAIRSAVGERIGRTTLIDDVSKGELKRLYGALSEDLTQAATDAGPQAARAAKRADAFYRAGMQRIENLERVINKNGGTEKIFAAVMSGTKEGATTLRAVMKSLKPEEKRFVTSAVVRRMGLATPGRQDASGQAFSIQTFLTNWARLSPEARGVLFGNMGQTFNRNMKALSSVAENIRDGSQVFSNPSGTQQALSLQATTGGAMLSAILGRLDVAGAIAGTAAGANLTSRLMTNERFVRWLAQSTKMPAGALPAQVNVLAQVARRTNDRDIAEAVALLEQQQAENAEQD